MRRNDPSMLVAFLTGTGIPEAEIAEIVRTQFPAAAGASSDQPVERKQ